MIEVLLIAAGSLLVFLMFTGPNGRSGTKPR